MTMASYVVMLSGGAASFCAAQRTVANHPNSSIELLFCDVGEEDESTYQSVKDAEKALGCDLHILKGLSVWELFDKVGMMGKPGAGLCSRILKRAAAKAWMEEHRPTATVVIGLTWEELHRKDGVYCFWGDRPVSLPMIADPWLTKLQMVHAMRDAGVTVPELYTLGGFEHSNCSGACVKAGVAQWLRLLDVRPAVYAKWEDNEEAFRTRTGKDVAILRDRRGGTTKPQTLRALRKRFETGEQIDLFASNGSCGCFTDDD